MTIQERWQSVQDSIAKTGVKAGTVRVLGVTKFQSEGRVKEAIVAGLRVLGNNYAQPGDLLMAHLKSPDLEWHFIGHIQSRKTKYLPSYHCVESLDRLSIAEDLNNRLGAQKKKGSVLVEINIGGEAEKSGIPASQLLEFLEKLSQFPNLTIRGLMGMPPPLAPVEARRPHFKALRTLYDSFATKYHFDVLSMGTSDDYLIAVEEGATLVRLGTTLFGPRPEILRLR